MRRLATWQQRARHLKREVYALYFAYQDPCVPWYARLVAAGVVAYAFSPIDLIPDFVPLLGYLDDLILLPLAILLALKLIPPAVLHESRARADAVIHQGKPVNKIAAVVIVGMWLGLAATSMVLIRQLVR